MKEDNEEVELNGDELSNEASSTGEAHSSYHVPVGDKRLQLSGMYQRWFIDYASYVIL